MNERRVGSHRMVVSLRLRSGQTDLAVVPIKRQHSRSRGGLSSTPFGEASGEQITNGKVST
ncbi:MAG: hypothetical protein WB611_13830, partial [Stellaceae bacterium]